MFLVQVWGAVPTNLVEAERNGATLVQRLAKLDEPGSSGKHKLALTDSTNSNKKKADGHKEEGALWSRDCRCAITQQTKSALLSHATQWIALQILWFEHNAHVCLHTHGMHCRIQMQCGYNHKLSSFTA